MQQEQQMKLSFFLFVPSEACLQVPFVGNILKEFYENFLNSVQNQKGKKPLGNIILKSTVQKCSVLKDCLSYRGLSW